MSASNRGFRGRNATFLGVRSADMPENIGNRKTFDELKIPPDNVGNRIERDAITTFVHDGLGNSVDEEPSHLRSGILTQLVGIRERPLHRRYDRASSGLDAARSVGRTPMYRSVKANDPLLHSDLGRVDSDSENNSGQDFMAHLTKEFSRLLHARAGVPFSFSMKPITDFMIDEASQVEALSTIKKLLEDILFATDIQARISWSEYRTVEHRFAVFFVLPNEKDPVKNKELISALRQIVKLHLDKIPSPLQINVLLVLANAQHVIEDHLNKIGAKKII